MDMRERLRPFGISFEKSLEDLIKGIRSTSSDPEKAAIFLDKAIQECKAELKTSDLELKSTAILKLAYLEMYGFDMSWCSFNILEVMASPKFQHKRIGYLAAIQILQRQNNDDALMLMTNLLKKDLNSVHYIETSLAISGIAAVVSKDLALDIVDDMAKMLSHSKPLIRKKAVLAMFKIFLKNPEALRAYYDRIVEKLEDPDGSVVSATVNVICELAHTNPSNYIDLAPRLYAMLKESNNNWMVIRLLKLFSSLSLTEPRLKYKILPEIKSLMLSTKALSLTYECINAILNGNMLSSDDIETAHLIVEKLLIFFESNDQNLRYVGLLAFIKTCKIHQKLIKKHDKIILTSIYDNDLTIRETSLDIVNSLVSEQNIVAIVTRLTVQLLPYKEQQEHLDEISRKLLSMENEREGELEEDGEDEDYENNSYNLIGSSQQPIVVSDKYKFLLINKIIEICSMNNYENIPNFKWYLGVLHDILKLNVDNKVSNVDSIISQQLVDIGVRVPSVRPKLVDMCLELCQIPGSSDEKVLMFKNGLSNCIWIVGEYYDEYIQDADVDSDADSRASNSDIGEDTKYSAIQIVDSISKQRSLERLGHINFDGTVSIYIQAIAKIFSKFCSIFGENKWSRSQFESVNSLSKKIITWFNKFQNSPNFEVQERALSFIEVLKLVEESIQSELETLESSGDDTAYPSNFLIKGFVPLFTATTIKPVGLKTQSKIQPPVDLDLGDAFNDQSIVDLQNIYNRLKMEDLDINFSDDEADDDKSEREDIYDEGTETDTENNSAFDDSGSERKQKKMPKNDHEDDPYYISLDDPHGSNKKENNTGKNDMSAEDAKKKHKKSLKPKKYKKEKVLCIEDDDDVDNAAKDRAEHPTEKDNEIPKHSAFLFDSSRLAGVDLKHSESTEEAFTNEYKEEVEKETDIPHEIKIETPSVQPVKRKPKKKVKKKVAVIE